MLEKDANSIKSASRYNRALQLSKGGHVNEALTEVAHALKLRPNDAELHFLAASILDRAGRLEPAAIHLKRQTQLAPGEARGWSALGNALFRLGRMGEAADACVRAVRLNDQDAVSQFTLARALHVMGNHNEAAIAFDRALRLDSQNAQAWNYYGNLLVEAHLGPTAVHCFRAALAIEPTAAEIYSNLGNLLKNQGKIDEAIQCIRRALKLKPQLWGADSNLLLIRNYVHLQDENLLNEHVAWARRHAAPFYPADSRFENERSVHRRLRVGYLSADFRRHPVGHFILPLLGGHGRDGFEVFCYSDVTRPDEQTQAIRAAADQWKDVAALCDDALAKKIREDRIDILIDLAGHMANRRLLVFARQAAPIQATYLGYPNTTGLATMNYRITDVNCDPPGLTENHYTERLVRLPGGFLCYPSPSESPPIVRKHVIDHSKVTFGSFNNFCKLTKEMIKIWAEILKSLPNSMMLIKAEAFADRQTQSQIRAAFCAHGVDESRILPRAREGAFNNHLALYNEVDIALDTFPYNGTTTTCEALWMGVPIITLAGKSHRSRVGLSLLTQLGLTELIAQTPDDYAAIARDLAMDVNRRKTLSDGLRNRMMKSPLMDLPGFVIEFERALRAMWCEWCE